MYRLKTENRILSIDMLNRKISLIYRLFV